MANDARRRYSVAVRYGAGLSRRNEPEQATDGEPMMIDRLVLGTGNRKKLLELQSGLAGLGCQLLSLAEVAGAIEVEETGEDFFANAALKATLQARQLGMWVLGEDSGLVVPALGGEPGVRSARFAGEPSSDAANNQLLLERMAGLAAPADRRAYYISTMVLADPAGEVHLRVEGRCWGRILGQPRGAGGFGYDPLFEVPEYHLTFAEMGGAAKGAISHRGRSVRQLRQAWLRRFA
jgi:XTP/dITP diphosphohydrolase